MTKRKQQKSDIRHFFNVKIKNDHLDPSNKTPPDLTQGPVLENVESCSSTLADQAPTTSRRLPSSDSGHLPPDTGHGPDTSCLPPDTCLGLHTSRLAPDTSRLTPDTGLGLHTSCLPPDTSHLTPDTSLGLHTSRLAPDTGRLTPDTGLGLHTSCLPPDTSLGPDSSRLPPDTGLGPDSGRLPPDTSLGPDSGRLSVDSGRPPDTCCPSDLGSKESPSENRHNTCSSFQCSAGQHPRASGNEKKLGGDVEGDTTFCESGDISVTQQEPRHQRPTRMTATLTSALVGSTLGQKELDTSISESPKDKWAKHLFYPVIDTLVGACNKRFSEEAMQIAKSVDDVLKCDADGAAGLIKQYSSTLSINADLAHTEMVMVKTSSHDVTLENLCCLD
ncbi:hypothetical protein ABVT39_023654 [Epinephelus coioides]